MGKTETQQRFLRSRAEQLADYLRGCIARGEICDPLPGIREWSARLGAGRGTLEQALHILHREGLLSVEPRRGIRLAGVPPRPATADRPRVVRWLLYGRNYPDMSVVMEILAMLSERLQAHDIHLQLERFTAQRFREIHKQGEHPNTMLFLVSLPAEFQRMFANFRKSAIVIGLPAEGVNLPFVSNDIASAMRHAIALVARRGFRRITMVATEATRSIPETLLRQWCAACDTDLHADLVRMPMSLEEHVTAARRFAARVTPGQGIIAVYPIPATSLISALLQHGLSIPRDAEVIGMNTTRAAVRVVPMPTHYPYPVEAFTKTVQRAILHYFEQGRVPRWKKLIPLEVVRAC